jgi:GNAT superfamily N-acetyltransferase
VPAIGHERPHVRLAVPGDRAAIVEFCRTTWGPDGGDYVEQAIDRWLASTDGALAVVDVDGRAAACCYIRFMSPRETFLAGMRVDPARRRSGLALALTRYCLEYAAARGHVVARLIVAANNAPALGAVGRAGFTRVGSMTFWERTVNGGVASRAGADAPRRVRPDRARATTAGEIDQLTGARAGAPAAPCARLVGASMPRHELSGPASQYCQGTDPAGPRAEGGWATAPMRRVTPGALWAIGWSIRELTEDDITERIESGAALEDDGGLALLRAGDDLLWLAWLDGPPPACDVLAQAAVDATLAAGYHRCWALLADDPGTDHALTVNGFSRGVAYHVYERRTR